MHQEDYNAVVSGHRLAAGQLFGLPIVMDTDRDDVVVGDKLLLTYKGQDLAVLDVEDKWEPDKVAEAKGCYGTTSIEHPCCADDHDGAQALLPGWKPEGARSARAGLSPARPRPKSAQVCPKVRTSWRSSAGTPFTVPTTSCSLVPCTLRTSVTTL